LLAGALLFGGVRIADASQPPATQPVTVMNTSASPVPVTGTVNVGNLPATQAVTGTVNIGNDDPQPFETEADGRLDTEFPAVTFQVPAGKRLLVDYITVDISAYAGTVDPSGEITGVYGGNFVRFFEHLDAAPASFGTSYGAQHQVRMSFDPGSTVQFDVHRTSGSDGVMFFNVHGELIPT
jgi:hypothetical protein